MSKYENENVVNVALYFVFSVFKFQGKNLGGAVFCHLDVSSLTKCLTTKSSRRKTNNCELLLLFRFFEKKEQPEKKNPGVLRTFISKLFRRNQNDDVEQSSDSLSDNNPSIFNGEYNYNNDNYSTGPSRKKIYRMNI